MRLFPAGVEQLTAQSFLHGSADAAGALVASLPGEHRSSRQALAPPPCFVHADNDAAYWQSWFSHPSTVICSKMTEPYALRNVGKTIAMACRDGAGEWAPGAWQAAYRSAPLAVLCCACLLAQRSILHRAGEARVSSHECWQPCCRRVACMMRAPSVALPWVAQQQM